MKISHIISVASNKMLSSNLSSPICAASLNDLS